MPRGRKAAPKTYEDQLALIESQMAEHKMAIEDLKGQFKALKANKKKEDTEALLAAIEATGKTIEEVLAEFQGTENLETAE